MEDSKIKYDGFITVPFKFKRDKNGQVYLAIPDINVHLCGQR